MAEIAQLEERDCPECHSAGSVRNDLCEVCYAELDEYPFVALDPGTCCAFAKSSPSPS